MADRPGDGNGQIEAPPTAPRDLLGWPTAWGAGIIAVALIVVCGAVVVALRTPQNRHAARGSATTTAPAGPLPILLEPRSGAGPDPFFPSVAAVADAAAPIEPPTTTAPMPSETSGDRPRLYGGSRTLPVCDTGALAAHLAASPDRATAWGSVLGVRPSAIPDYVAGLTPVVLGRDTLVTNHGFDAGGVQARQAILQTGTATLVDSFGVPRVRCSCGNPLTAPTPSAMPLDAAGRDGRIVVVGDRWSDWSATAVTVVKPATTGVTELVVWDIDGDGEFTVVAGSGAGGSTTSVAPTTEPDPNVTTTSDEPPGMNSTTSDPMTDRDCRNDPEGTGAGNTECDPETGHYLCYDFGVLSPCGQ